MEGFYGEIRMFGGNFAPRSWLFCQGQLMAIAQNTALFSILGTTYGGNGQTTFALPDLRSRMPVGSGSGPGLSPYTLGEQTGSEAVNILPISLPLHNHPSVTGTVKMLTTSAPADDPSPVNNYFANDGSTKYNTSNSGAIMKPANTNLAANPGAFAPVNTLVPYLGMNYIICIDGFYPSRN